MTAMRWMMLCLAVLQSGSPWTSALSQSAGQQKEAPAAEPIGMASMEPDGTIVLDIKRTADGINVSMSPRRYPKSDPDYAAVLAHVGPMKPGDVRLVMPWP